MKKKINTLFILLISICNILSAQKTSLPLSLYASNDTSKPLIFYISGDGGFNKFSTSFMQSLNKEGYAVIGLNAKDFFWNKKKPQEAATAIEDAINGSNKEWKKRNIVLIGYSFGADVSPFMLTHFSMALSNKVNHLVLLSPSSKTDFEIHVLQMFGWGKDEGESVPAEVNKISKPVTIIVGDDENEFPFDQLTIKNKQVIKMRGGHHYDGDVDALCKQIVQQIK
ncbi:MAG TPA: AcvB/VirJ family lysyl-phosphatidylglycerol hydrolase [Chitinophagaceae bacterium]|jgi:type IV secretory pathway VirJ component|nr:AcvB/VirJ family lysyl-phosphatidylglycerol hydrolase [Chitinophagaceae bacterium]